MLRADRAAPAEPAFLPALLDLLLRGLALALLTAGLFYTAAWVGRAVTAPGPWQAVDLALYQALNGLSAGWLTALLFTLLNEPGPNYFFQILLLLGYCWWRRPALLPAAALAMALALALGLAATREIHAAGGASRVRPFLVVAEARTPIAACDGATLVGLRDAAGPSASCEDPTAELRGLDWRTLWLEFPTFPSGHLRETAALCLLLGAFWPAARPFALAYALAMAFSRVHLGAHYPSDVLVGAGIGLWAGGISLLALDWLRRLLVLLHRVPALGAAWDWVFVSRQPGRPDRDPLAARLIRTGAYIALAQLALYGLGYASTSAGAGQLYTVLQNADIWVWLQLAARFDPAAAETLYYALGPAGPLYLGLGGLAVGLAWWRRRPPLGPTLLALVVAIALALELRWLGEQLFFRAPPVVQEAESPVPASWQERWPVGTSFPDRHALVAAALAGVVAGGWRALVLPALGRAAAPPPTSMYFGVAWVSDALAAYLLGNLAALVAWYAVAQFVPSAAVAIASSQRPLAAPVAAPADPRRRKARRR